MNISLSSRAACIAFINWTAEESDWLAVPHDSGGQALTLFVRKACARIVRCQRIADLFDPEGYASEMSEAIAHVALQNGLTAEDALSTNCGHLIRAVQEAESCE